MKKNLLLIALTALISLGIQAQNSFQLGLQLSPNVSWLKTQSENAESEGSKFGFSYGIIGDFNIAENYAVSTGIIILSTGGKMSYPDATVLDVGGTPTTFGGVTDADISLKYIEIPLTLKLKTNEIGYMTYYGQFGFSLGVNYDAEADIDFEYPGGTGALSQESVDFKDEINLLRAGLVVGLGAEYNLSGNTSILMGLTFNNGFTNILSEDGYDADQNGNGTGSRNKDFKAINNIITLNVGVLF